MIQIDSLDNYSIFKNLPNWTKIKWNDEVWILFLWKLISERCVVFDEDNKERKNSRIKVYLESKIMLSKNIAKIISVDDFNNIRNENYIFAKKLLKFNSKHSSLLAKWLDGHLHAWQEAEGYWIDLWSEWDAYYYKSYPRLIWRLIIDL